MSLNLITDRQVNDPDIAKLYYNVEDLNRVEAAMATVANLIEPYGYVVGLVGVKTDWVVTDFFKADDGARYLSNLNRIIDAYYSTAPLPPVNMDNINTEDANNIEKNLESVYDIFNSSIELTPTLAFTLGGEDI